jgi:hypothetical protein
LHPKENVYFAKVSLIQFPKQSNYHTSSQTKITEVDETQELKKRRSAEQRKKDALLSKK